MGRGRHAGFPAARAWWLLIVAASLACSVAVAGAATIDDKRAEAAEVADRIDELEANLSGLRERLRSSKAKLATTERQLRQIEQQLKRDQKRVRAAEKRLLQRLVTIYQEGAGFDDFVELMTAGSFSTLLDRLDAARFVSEQDQQLVVELQGLREAVAARQTETEEIRADQKRLVTESEDRATEIRETIAERRNTLGALEADIRQMVDEERQRAAERAARRSEEAARRIDPTEPDQTPPATSPGVGGVFAPPVLPPAKGAAAQAASIALQQVGKPYEWGATGPGSFDCSGLVYFAFGQVGISLPRDSYGMMGAGPDVPLSELQPGDLVFHHPGHVGIYIGGGAYVHSPQSGRNVEVVSMPGSVTFARRV